MNAPLTRRRLFATGCTLLAGLALPALAPAQDKYPGKPIRLILGLPAGGTADASVRQLTAMLQPALGQTIFVENRAGGNFTIAMQAVTQAPADAATFAKIWKDEWVWISKAVTEARLDEN